MIAYVMALAGAVKAYASEAGNLDLAGKMHLRETHFAVRDDLKDDVAQAIYDQAHPHLAALASEPRVRAKY